MTVAFIENNLQSSVGISVSNSQTKPSELSQALAQKVLQAGVEAVHQAPKFIGDLSHESSLVEKSFNGYSDNGDLSLMRYYCLSLIQQTKKQMRGKSADHEALINQVRQDIACAIYMADKDLSAAVKLIHVRYSLKTKEAFIGAVKNSFYQVHQNIATQAALQKPFGLQDQTLTANNCLPIEISTLLVTNQGLLNIGLVELIKNEFVPPESLSWFAKTDDRPPHKKYIANVLDRFSELLQDPIQRASFQKVFAEARPPGVDMEYSKSLITAMYGMDPSVELTHVHIKQALIADQLTFKPLAIVSLDRMIINMMDTAQMIAFGDINRKLAGESKAFALDTQIDNCWSNYGTKEFSFPINRKGGLGEDGYFISAYKFGDAPGIHAACKQMQIVITDEVNQKVVQYLFEGTEPERKLINVSVEQVIEAYAKVWIAMHPDQQLDFNLLEYKGFLGYSALDDSPIHLAKKLATITKANKEIESKIVTCTKQVLKGRHEVTSNLGGQRLQFVEKVFLKNLDKLIEVQYKSSEKQFTLYQRNGDTETKVSGPEEYVELVLNASQAAKEELKGSKIRKEVRKKYKAMINNITAFVKTPEFLEQSVRHFSTNNLPWKLIPSIRLDEAS